MMPVLLLAVLSVPVQNEPVYVMENPGIAFGWLPRELDPPAEGTMTRESGAIASYPGSQGYDFHLHYWFQEEDLNSAEKGIWLRQKLEALLPPDVTSNIVFGAMNWVEGSTAVSHLGLRSVGLTTSVNFNMLSENSVVYRGCAYGIFRDGYRVLIYGLAPNNASPAIGEIMELIIANSWMI